MNDDFDDLDRALFALPLEVPPDGLRAAILQTTSHAAIPSFALGRLDIALIGSVAAIAVWLLLALVTQPALGNTIALQLLAVTRAFAAPSTILWLAAGGAVVAWFSFGNVVVGSGRFERS